MFLARLLIFVEKAVQFICQVPEFLGIALLRDFSRYFLPTADVVWGPVSQHGKPPLDASLFRQEGTVCTLAHTVILERNNTGQLAGWPELRIITKPASPRPNTRTFVCSGVSHLEFHSAKGNFHHAT
jgi:hypothetical protein